MFDTHCHLNTPRLSKNNVTQLIQNAQDMQVTFFVVPGLDFLSSQNALFIAQNHEQVYASVGLYPSYVTSDYHSELEKMTKFIDHPKVVAVGEIGLDAQYAEEIPLDLQVMAVKDQLQTAISKNKSVILHNRNQAIELMETIESVWAPELKNRVVFHCCEANETLLEFAKEKGVFVGVDGDVTYDKTKQEFVKKVPLDMLVLETDSPYLLPEPLKSQKKYPNVPANLPLIAEKVAELKKVSLEELVEVTTVNGLRLFGIETK